jgi:hypothetical protein
MYSLSRRAVLAGLASVAAGLEFAGIGYSGPQNGHSDPQLDKATGSDNGAAQWLVESKFVASSLETGRIGYIVAWGGSEYGFAYTYALSGQPSGVTVDSDYGMLSIGTALSAGTYKFYVTATNRLGGQQATFPVQIQVKQGVTSGWTSGQILHKTYGPDSGTYGIPTGSDYTKVLQNIRTQAISDQNTVGDDNLRIFVPFQRGTTYGYTDNMWMSSMQFATFYDTGRGALPILECTLTDYTDSDQQLGIMQTRSSAIDDLDTSNTWGSGMGYIQTTNAGDSVVTLLHSTDNAKFTVGRWAMVVSRCTQDNGFPPNAQHIDYVKVVSISGTTITLDRKLKYVHRSDYWDQAQSNQIFGVAQLINLDTGGSGGIGTTDLRLCKRHTWKNIQFNINSNNSGGNNVQCNGQLDTSLEGCNMIDWTPSISRFMRCYNCTFSQAVNNEPDKLGEMLIFDTVNITNAAGEIDNVTGFEYLFACNSTFVLLYVSPRQVRMFGCTIDSTGNTNVITPLTFAGNGPCFFWDFHNCSFQAQAGATQIFSSRGQPASGTFSNTFAWSGNTLQIKTTDPSWENWLGWLDVNSVISTNNTPPVTSNWGHVTGVRSSGDGAAIWYDVQWVNGTKPTSGTIYGYRGYRGYRISFDSACTLGSHATWRPDGAWIRVTVPVSWGSSYNGPVGWPGLPSGT